MSNADDLMRVSPPVAPASLRSAQGRFCPRIDGPCGGGVIVLPLPRRVLHCQCQRPGAYIQVDVCATPRLLRPVRADRLWPTAAAVGMP
jgi:hypothetical protein